MASSHNRCTLARRSAPLRTRAALPALNYNHAYLSSRNDNMQQLTLPRPDDWHLHLRDDALMQSVLPDTVRRFARAIVMPHLRPPVTGTEQALAYRARILAALAAGSKFEPLMTLY